MCPNYCIKLHIKALFEKVNRQLAVVCARIQSNKLSLNIAVTNHLTASPNLLAVLMNTGIDGQNIMEVNGTTFLQLSSIVHLGGLTGDVQNDISNTISKDVSVTNKVLKIFDRIISMHRYNTLLLCYIMYCIYMWGSD